MGNLSSKMELLFKGHWLQMKFLNVFASYLPDEWYLKKRFFYQMGYHLDLDNPKSLNEKLQWLKLHDRRPEYTTMVDKYEVKKYVAGIIGEKHIVPTYKVYNNADEINIDELPDQFVLKCNHDSGSIAICKDKSKFDIDNAKKSLQKGLTRNFYKWSREWPYKDVKPKIIAEKYLADESGWQLKDYKVFCFNGVPKFVEVDYDRYVGHKLNVYDLDWNFIDFYMTSPNDKNVIIEKPRRLDLILELAKKLSHNIPFVRADFYSINEDVYFSELTFHPGSGMIDFHPKEYDWKVGEMLQLPFEK